MMDNSKTNESQENLHTDQLSQMAKDYVQLWQKQWVSTMADPKTQESLKEYYQTISSMYEKNTGFLNQYAEVMKHAQASAPANAAQQSNSAQSNTDGTAAIYATLEQCLDVLERFGERLTSLETRIDKLEKSSGKPRRKASKPKRKS